MNWMRYWPLYLFISLCIVIPGMVSVYRWGLNLDIDFLGGTIVQYKLGKEVGEDKLKEIVKSVSLESSSINKVEDGVFTLHFVPLTPDKVEELTAKVKSEFSGAEELKVETVGALVGPELIKKTIFAIAISAGAIMLWVAYQFKSIKYGVSAVLAMLHDSMVLIGIFSLLGHYRGIQVDFLFVTALLTILSFSVHDTIVVFDRIRETQKKFSANIKDMANKALTETMVRSFNNSMTIVFMLIALLLLGGESVRWFALALLIGTVSGTYSSPFVAVPLLVYWDNIFGWVRKKS